MHSRQFVIFFFVGHIVTQLDYILPVCVCVYLSDGSSHCIHHIARIHLYNTPVLITLIEDIICISVVGTLFAVMLMNAWVRLRRIYRERERKKNIRFWCLHWLQLHAFQCGELESTGSCVFVMCCVSIRPHFALLKNSQRIDCAEGTRSRTCITWPNQFTYPSSTGILPKLLFALLALRRTTATHHTHAINEFNVCYVVCKHCNHSTPLHSTAFFLSFFISNQIALHHRLCL